MDPIRDGFGHARDHRTAVAVADEHNVRQLLIQDHIDHIGDVGCQIDLRRSEVASLSEPCQRGPVGIISAVLERVGDWLPIPSPAPGAMHQDDVGRCRFLGFNMGRHEGHETDN